MSLEVTLTNKLTQQLQLSAELRLAIKLLSLNQVELNQEIERQISENPVLESENDDRFVVSKPEDSRDTTIAWFESGGGSFNTDKEEFDIFDTISAGPDQNQWRSELREQAGSFELSANVHRALVYLIENLSERGYLLVDKDQLINQDHCSEDLAEAEENLRNRLEPAGIGAKDLRDSLLLQLSRQGLSDSLRYKVVSGHLADLAQQNLTKIAKHFGCSVGEVAAIKSSLRKLQPYPILSGGREEVPPQSAIADLKLVKNKQNSWEILLTMNNLPQLSVSEYYLFMLNNNMFKDKVERSYIKGKFRDANWFMQAIIQRNQTIKIVAETIYTVQSEFMLGNSNQLRPLKLADIAEKIEMHESSVSRAVAGKYIETPAGLFPLKLFFDHSVSKINPEQTSSTLKTMIADIIRAEDKQNPLSDQKVVELLAKKSIILARRTVAKYRTELKIPGTRQRKAY